MSLEGGIVMKNVNIFCVTPYLDSLYVNNTNQVGKNYTLGLQSRLQRFRHMLFKQIDVIKAFFLTDGRHVDYWNDWINEIEATEQWLKESGDAILTEIITKLEAKDITTERFKHLTQILDNQIEIARNLFSVSLDTEYVKTLLNYLMESPGYIKYDLSIDRIPNNNYRRVIVIDALEGYLTINGYDLTMEKLTA
jgi:hypothetical protein